MGAFVYILQCADDSYYVGSARGDDLDKRFYEHQTGALGGYTSTRRPVRLVFHEHFERITDAIAAERPSLMLVEALVELIPTSRADVVAAVRALQDIDERAHVALGDP